jgi:phospholipase/lecithinase/hemolysin
MTNRVQLSPCLSRITSVIGLILVSGLWFALQADTVDAIYAFGDSLSDVGNIYHITGGVTPGSPYVNGQFTNGNVWVQDLAIYLGLPLLKPSLLGGTDYAYGSAETGATSFNTAPANTDLTGSSGQIAQFQATHAVADPNALYTIWIGSNDLNDMLANAAQAQYGADIGTIVANIDDTINVLAGMGAKNFLVLNVPNLGDTPAAMALGPAASAGASEVSAILDSVLANGEGPIPSLAMIATADSINIASLNTYALLDAIVANPASYGLTNVIQPCLTGEVNYSGGTPCTNPDQYLFWDDLHPTAAGHQLVADEAAAIVTTEPGSFSLVLIGAVGLSIAFRSRIRREIRRILAAGYRYGAERPGQRLAAPICAMFISFPGILVHPATAMGRTGVTGVRSADQSPAIGRGVPELTRYQRRDFAVMEPWGMHRSANTASSAGCHLCGALSSRALDPGKSPSRHLALRCRMGGLKLGLLL